LDVTDILCVLRFRKYLNSNSGWKLLQIVRSKVRINALVAKAQKVPDEGWTMPGWNSLAWKQRAGSSGNDSGIFGS
jgi:hypothetical protein